MMKDKLFSVLGGFGIFLYYVIILIISGLPFAMIDLPFFVIVILILVEQMLPFTSIIFWIWGLVSAINGPQDGFATAFYIAFVVLFVPYFISIIRSIFKK